MCVCMCVCVHACVWSYSHQTLNAHSFYMKKPLPNSQTSVGPADRSKAEAGGESGCRERSQQAVANVQGETMTVVDQG